MICPEVAGGKVILMGVREKSRSRHSRQPPGREFFLR